MVIKDDNMINTQELEIETWQEHADSRTLSKEETFLQKILQIVLHNKEVRISEFKDNKLSFMIEFEGVDGLQIKEVSIEDFIENHCKLWANIRMVKLFINWDYPAMKILRRIEKVASYSSYGELFDEAKIYDKYDFIEKWGSKKDDAFMYLIKEDRAKKDEENSYYAKANK